MRAIHAVFVILSIALFMGCISCGVSSSIRKEATSGGQIEYHYDAQGTLLKKVYPGGSTYTYANKGRTVTHHDKDHGAPMTAYLLDHPAKAWRLEGFTVGDARVTGTAFFGVASIGPLEMVLIPDADTTYSFKGKIGGPVEYLYLRFPPAWYTKRIQPLLKETALDPAQQRTARAVHISHLRNFAHISEFAYPNPSVLGLLKLRFERVLLWFNGAAFIPSGREFPLSRTWNRVRKDGLSVYLPDNSVLGGARLDAWIDGRLAALRAITGYLRIDPARIGEVSIYAFNDKGQGHTFGYNLGFAVPASNCVYTTIDQTRGHELAHIVAYRFGNGARVRSALLNEGLSTWLDQSGRDYHAISRELLASGKSSTRDFFDAGFRMNKLGYWLGASFVGYLVDTHGLERFRALFAQERLGEREAFPAAYGKDRETLRDEWRAWLAGYVKPLSQLDRKGIAQMTR